MPEITELGFVIKPTYEDEPNTNAFTDAEKSKLDGIEPGAQVNSVASVNGATGDVSLGLGDLNNVDTSGASLNDGLKFDGTIWVPGAAGGVVYLAPDLFANRPAANSVPAGTIFYATDVLQKHWVSDGTNWIGIFHSHPIVEPPPAADWTTVSNKTVSLTDYGGYNKFVTAIGSTATSAYMLRPIPAGDEWTVEAELMSLIGSGNITSRMGIVLTDGVDLSTCRYEGIYLVQSNATRQFGCIVGRPANVGLLENPVTLAGYFGDIAALVTAPSYNFRISRTTGGTRRRYGYSLSGSWLQPYDRAWTQEFTPTHIGIFHQHTGAAGYEYSEINLVNWRVY